MCQSNSMMCPSGQNQLCGSNSDCLGSGMVCNMINVGPATIGVCFPGDGGTSGEGGKEGGSEGGSSSSGGDAGDSGSDTGATDAPSEGG
jgi:hypothetical protein